MNFGKSNWLKNNATELIAVGLMTYPHLILMLQSANMLDGSIKELPLNLTYEQWHKGVLAFMILGLRK